MVFWWPSAEKEPTAEEIAKEENRLEVEELERIHADQNKQLTDEIWEKQKNLNEEREKNYQNIRSKQKDIENQQADYIDTLNDIDRRDNERRNQIQETSSAEIKNMWFDFEQQKREGEKKHQEERNKLEEQLKEQKKTLKKDVNELEKQQDDVRQMRMNEIEKFNKDEMERTEILEKDLKNAMAESAALKAQQIQDARERLAREHETKQKIMQQSIETMMTFECNRHNETLVNSFNDNVLAKIGDTSNALEHAVLYFDCLGDGQKKADDQDDASEWLKKWEKSRALTVNNIRSLRASLNILSTADNKLREEINTIIADVEKEYVGVQTQSQAFAIAVRKQSQKQLDGIVGTLSTHKSNIEKITEKARKIIIGPDTTFEQLRIAYEKKENQKAIQ